jgi:hypothetical protein
LEELQFIDDNLKMREQYAEETTEFLEGELQRVEKFLQAQEKTVVYRSTVFWTPSDLK